MRNVQKGYAIDVTDVIVFKRTKKYEMWSGVFDEMQDIPKNTEEIDGKADNVL